jgi:PBP1b-binding outer membrane lipoprotein LpoB
MSDVAPEVPAAAPTEAAPATAAPAEAPAPAADAPATPEPAPAPAVEVVAQQPSSASEEDTFVEDVVEKFVDIFDAAKRLVELVEQHRTIGDGEVTAAVADVKSAVAANAPAETDAPEA